MVENFYRNYVVILVRNRTIALRAGVAGVTFVTLGICGVTRDAEVTSRNTLCV
jgi:hypothetical protein